MPILSDSEDSRECEICAQGGIELTSCTFCGMHLCEDCRCDHEFECEDRDE